MSQEAFAAAFAPWHDFYLAAAGATAALLGLLFVGVSINLAALAADERVDLRARAGTAFANLVYVLVISLLMLIPDPEPHAIAISFGAVAALGLGRVVQHLVALYRARTFYNQRQTLRRIAWTVAADVVLLYVATRIYTAQDARVIGQLVWVIFVLLIGAADVAWDMLVRVSQERDRKP
jgi:hypothetical protein